MSKSKTTLQLVRDGKITGRVSSELERRRIHQEIDRVYNTAAKRGVRLIGFTAVSQFDSDQFAGSLAHSSSLSEDVPGMLGYLRILMHEMEQNEIDRTGHPYECRCVFCVDE